MSDCIGGIRELMNEICLCINLSKGRLSLKRHLAVTSSSEREKRFLLFFWLATRNLALNLGSLGTLMLPFGGRPPLIKAPSIGFFFLGAEGAWIAIIFCMISSMFGAV